MDGGGDADLVRARRGGGAEQRQRGEREAGQEEGAQPGVPWFLTLEPLLHSD